MNTFQKNLLIIGYSILAVWIYIAWITYTAHPHYDSVDTNTLKEYKTTPDTSDVLSVYIPGDIAHIYFAYNAIMFENGGDPLEFSSREDMYEYISEMTAYSSCTIGYQGDLDYNIRNGYIYARTIYNEDEQYTDLVYDGPNWTIDAKCDTSYVISTFNHVEKIYNPKTKSIEYDHYSID